VGIAKSAGLRPLEPSKKADQARVKGEVEVGEMLPWSRESRIRAKAALKSFAWANENRRRFFQRGMRRRILSALGRLFISVS
jgi:hypothetical protein